MKKFLKVLFNIFWAIFIGIESVIVNGAMGVVCCCTIIGIPFGLRYFKYIPLVFAPAGKTVVTKFSRHPVMNTLWLIFGGLEIGLVYTILGILFHITIIGIPIGRQLLKIASYNFAPFGCEILEDGEYSKDQDTAYDTALVCRRIAATPDMSMGKNADGTDYTVRQHLIDKKDVLLKGMYGKELKNSFNWFIAKHLHKVISILLIPLPLIAIAMRDKFTDAFNSTHVAMIVFLVLFLFIEIVSSVLNYVMFAKPYAKFSVEFLKPLMGLYPNGSPMGKANVSDLKLLCSSLGIVPPPTKDMVGTLDKPAEQPAPVGTESPSADNSEPFAETVAPTVVNTAPVDAVEKTADTVEKVADTVVESAPVEEKKED